MMTPLFRVVLIAASVGTLAIILSKIRKSKIDIEDSVFWILMSLMFVLFAVFPIVPDTMAALLGIYSTANFLFLFIIFILLIKMFGMSMRIGQLEERIKSLVQKLALERVETDMDDRIGETGVLNNELEGTLDARDDEVSGLSVKTGTEAVSGDLLQAEREDAWV